MASSKNKGQSLDDLLTSDIPQGVVKKGPGLHTSLDEKDISAKTHERTNAPERIARGYKFREDLIIQCKLIALNERRKLYEVMEEALEEYIARKQIEK
jgi:hypothetical protein